MSDHKGRPWPEYRSTIQNLKRALHIVSKGNPDLSPYARQLIQWIDDTDADNDSDLTERAKALCFVLDRQ